MHGKGCGGSCSNRKLLRQVAFCSSACCSNYTCTTGFAVGAWRRGRRGRGGTKEPEVAAGLSMRLARWAAPGTPSAARCPRRCPGRSPRRCPRRSVPRSPRTALPHRRLCRLPCNNRGGVLDVEHAGAGPRRGAAAGPCGPAAAGPRRWAARGPRTGPGPLDRGVAAVAACGLGAAQCCDKPAPFRVDGCGVNLCPAGVAVGATESRVGSLRREITKGALGRL